MADYHPHHFTEAVTSLHCMRRLANLPLLLGERNSMANGSHFNVPEKPLDVFPIFGLHAGAPTWIPLLSRRATAGTLCPTLERDDGIAQTRGPDMASRGCSLGYSQGADCCGALEHAERLQ